ncbi:MAG: hypothetical protein B7Z14_14965 [Bosea sp. 32-68-6]|nr:MAG: hypothetical protein B7Z14_14965 [Bosea sp. 32-68-6]
MTDRPLPIAAPAQPAKRTAPAAMSPLEALGAELGAIAAQIDRETRLRLDAGLAEIRRVTSEMELRFERLERALLDSVAVVEPSKAAEPTKADKPRVRVPAGSARP